MEVAKTIDRVTHAVIGGQEAESMGIADDPAFYHMLSSTLYSDEKKAVVRETLCNAWDAHIEAGCTDKPLEVSLTTDKLSIQDFGLGICRHMIKPIYGIYGASTKKANSEVTGGFGLGCKAPFAYADHFEVVSCHQGEKTIYRMSKSSGAVMGKPSIQAIVSVPTTDTGITVSMAIKYQDRDRFSDLVRQVASQGGMKVNFNGEVIEPMPFELAKHGYLIMSREKLSATNSEIFVRYGNVVYPVEANNAYHSSYQKIVTFLARLRKQGHYYQMSSVQHWAIVFQAEPNTISVTPSRESLSMSAHTIKTLTGLINKFDDKSFESTELRRECFLLVRGSIEDAAPTRPVALLTLSQSLVEDSNVAEHSKEYIADIKDAAGHLLLNSYPKNWMKFHDKVIDERFKNLINVGYGVRGLLQTYRCERIKINQSRRPGYYYKSSWFDKRIVYPIVQEMKKHPQMVAKNFGVWDAMSNSKSARNYSMTAFMPMSDYSRPAFDDMLGFTRGLIIIGHSRISIGERIHRVPEMQKWGKPRQSLCYLVTRSPRKVAAAVKFFTDIGLNVIDTTAYIAGDPTPEELVIERAARVPAPKKKKVEGYPLLSNLINLDEPAVIYAEDSKRRLKPEFAVVISPNSSIVRQFDNLYIDSSGAIRAVIGLYGARGVGVPTILHVKKAIEEGAKEFIPFLIEETLKVFKTDPKFKEHFEHQINHLLSKKDSLDPNRMHFFRFMMRDEVLRKKFKLPARPKIDMLDHITIAQSLLFGNVRRESQPELHELKELIFSWEPNALTMDLVDKIRKSTLLFSLEQDFMTNCYPRLNEDHKKTVRGMFLTALQGK